MKYSLSVLCVIAAVALQFAFAPFAEIKGGRPDFVLIVVIALTVLHGRPREALALAALAGVLMDLLGGRMVGAFTAGYLLVSFLAGVFQRRFYQDNILLMELGVFSAFFLRQAVYALLVLLFTPGFEIPFPLERLYAGALYTALLFPLLYRGISRLVRLEKELALRY